ncbi:uncharacterized protein SPSK_01103 [Sporothrix schenckii 1099-18]|uniref:SPX domain-containing protein n=2 Tax=Sporothrix schenckii TaxID=29908 RepID=U7PLX7_SPOS1|nr:uncharacterized protein SPSK_01103 [Sporothrix schenckii 1099-18]ERS96658.1 hypothetical protein HMPREF1624_06867 [Sporothrix schenckii ATCC 58251]KJR81348.1 hypothetical protein SPSK_01103 [Sporothrix schenckii 1099-18]
MKFGRQFESESVPEWSLHNIDYNTLKDFIKVHTTRHQASAITIPGQTDTALQRFESEFYDELCRQHDRVGLFVATKADEINRRLQHLSDQIHRLLLRSTTAARGTTALKRQRRFVKYERATLALQDETKDLSRFVNAQVVAFRKILKKYKKWTGSGALTLRFRDNVLSDPKSFTRRQFDHLYGQCDELLATLRVSTPLSSSPQTPRDELSSPEFPESQSHRPSHGHTFSSSSSTIQALSSSAGSSHPAPPQRPASQGRRLTLLASAPVQTHYWNEYDDGSEAGDIGNAGHGGYAIYLHPDEEEDFPGMATLVSFFTVPLEKAKKWMVSRTSKGSADRGPLLSQSGGFADYGTTRRGNEDGGGLFDALPQYERDAGMPRDETARVHHDGEDDGGDDADHDSTEEDDAFASDSDFPHGYETYYAALPSIDDQRLARYRETMLVRAMIGCFAGALVLLGVASILISTGKHKLRVEVDAGVIMGVMASLGFTCAALGMNMARRGTVSVASTVAVWSSFAIICALNGAVLVLVMGNTVIANIPS